MHSHPTIGHLVTLFTVLIWGTTFISTKVLLTAFSPVEILFLRFSIGFVSLLLIYPHRLPKTTPRQELFFAAAGLSGICLYYLMENIALTYTMASNVGVIVSAAPFFTALLAQLVFHQKESLHASFLMGFLVAMVGIFLISFNGSALQLNPLGDLLALLAAFFWACYSNFTKKIGAFGYPTILITRRIFFYGIVFMLPALYFFDVSWNLAPLRQPVYLGNLLFLGFGASALCFVTWNFAVKILGVVTTSIYIYTTPVITLISSALILQEPITPLACAGTLLTLTGLVLSEWKPKKHGSQNVLPK